MVIKQINTDLVIKINHRICSATGEALYCLDQGKVDSALHSAFYPGSSPYSHGGLTSIAAAMAFYLVKAHAFMNGNKRTATAAALVFLKLNGYVLTYPKDALADVILAVVMNECDLDQLKLWFEVHKEKYS